VPGQCAKTRGGLVEEIYCRIGPVKLIPALGTLGILEMID
jgi:hypothetical protein